MATMLVVIGALAVRVSRLEWALLILAIGLVWAMEALNTAIELLADEVSVEHRCGSARPRTWRHSGSWRRRLLRC